MAAAEFYDIHCHAHTLSHPSFLALLETARSRKIETLYSQVSSFNYLTSSLFHKGGEKLRNMLAVMENEPGDIFCIMEDDLAGFYGKNGTQEALLKGGRLLVGDNYYDRLILVPLLIDFNQPDGHHPDAYYNHYPHKPIEAQVMDVLNGISAYRMKRPSGFLEICPFLGVNPKSHTPQSMEAFLDTWFSGFVRSRQRSGMIFDALGNSDVRGISSSLPFFGGIKLYPPLGFDPWPGDRAERDTVEVLYSFCEKKNVPLITHCDDEGFRTIGLEDAWRQTDPASYRPALQEHPDLILDFAHFGAQYTMTIKGSYPTDWRNSIISLMLEYPNVYTDLSFNGVEPSYYDGLVSLLGGMKEARRETVVRRVMFGSDFLVNLLRAPSYLRYFRDFSESRLSSDLKNAFGSTNPRRFLFGD
ncbi:MAG: amidohydrolase [Spirochaetaceae bacterium]|nr:amidohydrolase [Spirochaetaceae bacterium]